MDAAAWGFIGTLFGALVGASASIATTFFNNRHAAMLHSKESEAAREEQRRVFQRETLLQLQDDFHRFMRNATRAHLEDLEGFRKTGKWAATPLSAEVDTGWMEAARDVSKLIERIADDALRGDIKAVVRMTGPLARETVPAEAQRLHSDLVERALAITERMGRALRAQY